MKVVLAAVLLAVASVPAEAARIFRFTPFGTQTLSVTTTTGVFDIEAFDHGWYDSTGFHNPANTNYFTCDINCEEPVDGFNSFQAFRLGTITGTFLSATLSLGSPTNGYIGPAFSTSNVWDFTGNFDALLAGSGGVGAYGDLGSGVEFASRLVSAATDNTQVVYQLNAAALAAISAALSSNQGPGVIAFGVTISEDQVIPEPMTVGLVGAGLAAMLARRRTSRRR